MCGALATGPGCLAVRRPGGRPVAARAPGGLARAAGGRLSQEGCVGAGCRAAERPGRAVGGRASGSARPARRGPRGPPVSGASGLCRPCCVAVLLQEPRPAGLSACSRVRRARHRGRAGTCGAHRTSQLDPVNCWGFSWAQGPEGQSPPPSPLPGHSPHAGQRPFLVSSRPPPLSPGPVWEPEQLPQATAGVATAPCPPLPQSCSPQSWSLPGELSDAGDRPPGTGRVGGAGACGAVPSLPVPWG